MKILFYEKENGTAPAKDFIDDCTTKEQVRILKTINLLEEYGNQLDRPYAAPLRDGINELRINGTDKKLRILYFFQVGDIAVLTHGFVKKSRAVPSKEISKAIKYRDDYARRNGNE